MYGCKFDPKKATEEIVDAIKGWFYEEMGQPKGIVIGLSGGKDSAVAAALCCRAIGSDKVLGVIMPDLKRNIYDVYRPVKEEDYTDDMNDALCLVKELGVETKIVPIGDIVSVYKSEMLNVFEILDIATVNNIKARIRMMILYAFAQEKHMRVCCTSNASEIYLGYSTKYGDFAGDFAPLSHLTKTQVVEVGRYLGLPEHLIEKTPSDGMCGKTDEDAFGFTYMDLDFYLTNGSHPDKSIVNKIESRHNKNLHKSLPMLHFEL